MPFKKIYTYKTPKGLYQLKDTLLELEIQYPTDHTSKHYVGGCWIFGYDSESKDFNLLIERCDNFNDAFRVLNDIHTLTRHKCNLSSCLINVENVVS